MARALLLLACSMLVLGCGDRAPVTYDADGHVATGRVRVPRRPMSLAVILIDGLRADTAGDSRHMPFLAALRRQGVTCTGVAAPSPRSLPSVASVLTGMLPFDHGCDGIERSTLPPRVATYAEVLRRTYGLDCAAFVDTPWFDGPDAVLQGFDVAGHQLGLSGFPAALERWNRGRDAGRPFFLFVHTLEVAAPYGPPPAPDAPFAEVPGALPDDWQVARDMLGDPPRREAWLRVHGAAAVAALDRARRGRAGPPPEGLAAELRRLYEAGVRRADEALRAAVAALEAEGLLRDTLLVVSAARGEAFGEHGVFGEGGDVHGPSVHVPLVAVGPHLDPGERVAPPAGLIDLLPTYFDIVGFEPIPSRHARSMKPLLRKGEGRPVIVQERTTDGWWLTAVRERRHEYVASFDAGARALREVLSDPREPVRVLAPPWRTPATFCEAVEEACRRLEAAAPVEGRLTFVPCR